MRAVTVAFMNEPAREISDTTSSDHFGGAVNSELPVDRDELRAGIQSEYAAVAVVSDDDCHFHAGRFAAEQAFEAQCTDDPSNRSLSEWCLGGGHRIRNPFAHYLDYTLLIESSAGQNQQEDQQLQEKTT